MRRTWSRILLAPTVQTLSYRCAIALFLSIVIVGALPGAREEVGKYASGVVLHSLAYAILATLLFLGSNGDRTERAVKSVLTIVVMGAGDEYVQSFVPYRTASVADWMIDVIAGSVTSALSWHLRPKLAEAG